MSLASVQADIDSAMETILSDFAVAQEDFKFLYGRYWSGTSTHTSLPVDGSSSSADLSGEGNKGEVLVWDDMVTLGSIPCALECRQYKAALYSVGNGYVVKLKFIYSGAVYQRTQDSGYDSRNTVAWASTGSAGLDAPIVESISPTTGSTAGGTAITVTGTGFIVGGTTTVAIGGNACTSISVVSSTSITCTTPAGTGVDDIVVTNTDSQTSTLGAAFTYAASAPAFVQADGASGSGAGGIDIVMPAAVTVGNLLICCLSSNALVGWTAPTGSMGTGWTQLHSGKLGYQVFYKIATATGTTCNIDDSGAAKADLQSGLMIEISGVNATPIDVSAATENSGTSPSVTTTVDNCLVLTLGVSNNPTDDYSTVPTGFTSAGREFIGADQVATIAYKVFATLGATGTLAWDAGTYTTAKVFTVAVKP